MKHKALKKEKYRRGAIEFKGIFYANLVKDPLAFASSDSIRKIKNRNKRRK